MARYADILKGPDLAEDYAKYRLWQAKSRDAKRVDYQAVKAKPSSPEWERVLGFILPFNTLSENIYFETKVLLASQASVTLSKDAATIAVDLTNNGVVLEVPSGKESVDIPRYQFAKVIAVERAGSNGDKKSRITDRTYKQYQTISASSAFGRAAAAASFGAARSAMLSKASYKAFIAKPGNRISIIPERG